MAVSKPYGEEMVCDLHFKMQHPQQKRPVLDIVRNGPLIFVGRGWGWSIFLGIIFFSHFKVVNDFLGVGNSLFKKFKKKK